MPGISAYKVLLIRCSNIWCLASVATTGKVYGGSVYLVSNNSQRFELELSISGDTLTYIRALEVRGSSVYRDNLALSEIVGLF